MSESDFIHDGMSRRNFLKTTAVASAAVGIAATPGTLNALTSNNSTAEAAADHQEQIFQGLCRGNCGGGCAMNVHVRQGKVVKTSRIKRDDPTNDRLCVRGLTHAQRIYGPDRLKYPMRRVGERGSGQWEQLSWNEAIAYIAGKWKGYIQQDGPSSIVESKAYGNLSLTSEYPARLFNVMGATNMECGYDMNLIPQGASTFGMGMNFIASGHEQLMKAKYIFVWGGNPIESAQVRWVQLKNALDAGAKLIVIDPIKTGTAMKADMFVPIRTGTDGALALAMMNIAVAEGKIDHDTIAKGTVGPFLVKESDGRFLRLSDLGKAAAGSPEDAIVVRSESGQIGPFKEIPNPVIKGSYMIENIKVTTAYDLLLAQSAEWTPEKAAQLCDIPVETIYKLTHMFAEGPTIVYGGYGHDHMGNGAMTSACLFALELITGQFGKEGTGYYQPTYFLGYGIFQPAAVANPPESKPRNTITALAMMDVIDSGKYNGQDYPINSMYIYNHNLLGNGVDRKKWIELLNKLDLVVVADIFMTDTTMYADIVLPVPDFFEVETISVTQDEYNSYSEKAVDPAFESKGDLEIINALGQAMGYSGFTMTAEKFFEATLDNPVAKSYGVTLERFKKEKWVKLMKPYVFGADYTYPTATTKAQFYTEPAPNTPLEQRKYVLPLWEPPLEAWSENPLFKKYPLTYLSQRSRFKSHTQFGRNPWLLEIEPEPTLKINPDDAKARGIKNGDTIKAFNDRGHVVLKAKVSANIRPGVAVIQHGWQKDQFIDGHYSDVTSRAYNPLLYPGVSWYDTLIEVTKM